MPFMRNGVVDAANWDNLDEICGRCNRRAGEHHTWDTGLPRISLLIFACDDELVAAGRAEFMNQTVASFKTNKIDLTGSLKFRFRRSNGKADKRS